MISALIVGELVTEPTARTTSKGASYVTANMRVPAGAEALFVGVAAFERTAGERLLRLHKGASLAAAGALEATEWEKDGETRKGWRLTATEILSHYAARKRRDAEGDE